MSKGIGAYPKKIAEDDSSVIYEYGGNNLNDSRYRNEGRIYDGTITKRIPVEVHYGEMIAEAGLL